MIQFLIENKETVIPIIAGIILFIFREVIDPALRHFVQNLPAKWHIDPTTGELILKGVDRILEKKFGRTAMLMNAKADPGDASDKLATMIINHAEKKFMVQTHPNTDDRVVVFDTLDKKEDADNNQ